MTTTSGSSSERAIDHWLEALRALLTNVVSRVLREMVQGLVEGLLQGIAEALLDYVRSRFGTTAEA
jgi:hypothetical protein